MALSERQVANLWARLDQLGPMIRQAQKNLADAEAAGRTRRETATIRKELRQLTKEREDINRRLSEDAKDRREDPPPTTGGTTMGLGESRAMLQSANESFNEALGLASGVATAVESGQGALMQASGDIDANDLTTAQGLVAQASEGAREVQQQLSAAISSIDDYITRMS